MISRPHPSKNSSLALSLSPWRAVEISPFPESLHYIDRVPANKDPEIVGLSSSLPWLIFYGLLSGMFFTIIVIFSWKGRHLLPENNTMDQSNNPDGHGTFVILGTK